MKLVSGKFSELILKLGTACCLKTKNLSADIVFVKRKTFLIVSSLQEGVVFLTQSHVIFVPSLPFLLYFVNAGIRNVRNLPIDLLSVKKRFIEFYFHGCEWHCG